MNGGMNLFLVGVGEQAGNNGRCIGEGLAHIRKETVEIKVGAHGGKMRKEQIGFLEIYNISHVFHRNAGSQVNNLHSPAFKHVINEKET